MFRVSSGITFKKIICFCMLVACFYLLPGTVFSAPYDGKIFDLMQPDKTLVPVKVFGDEFYQDVESLDGFTLIRDPQTDWICYAVAAADGQSYISTGIIYQPASTASRGGNYPDGIPLHVRIKTDAKERLAKTKRQILFGNNAAGDTTRSLAPEGIMPAPFGGNIIGLTLLIDFPDKKSAISRDEIVKLLNQQGYSGYSNNGSVRDYFYEVSNGALTYTNLVTQFVTVSKPKSYYDDNSEYGHVIEIMKEALNLLKAQGNFDFDAISKTGTRFYAVNVLYAGSPSAGWAKGLWPHSGDLGKAWSINGTYVRNYQMSDIGSSLSIGTIVHENGHMLLDFDDLYAYDNHDNGVGAFCVMCMNDEKNPQMFNPYFRYLKGWLNYTDIGNTANASYSCIANAVASAYYYGKNGGGTEFFLIEARRKKGRSAVLPAEGLLIWHVNTKGDNKYSGTNYVSVEQADGKNDLEKKVNKGDANDTFRSGYKTDFNDSTTPNARYNSGTNSGLNLKNVSAIGDLMTFNIGNGGPLITPTPTPTSTPTPIAFLKGDVNSDGKIDIVDAMLIAQYTVGMNPANFNKAAADVNNSGSIDILDALLIAQYSVGIITSF